MKIKYMSIVIFAVGLLVGAFAQYRLPQFFPSATEKVWRSQHNEDSSHARIIVFQDVLNKLGTPRDVNALNQQLDAQLKIENLIIQSRAAEYANLAPITSLSSSVGTLLVAILGFAAGLIGRRRNRPALQQ